MVDVSFLDHLWEGQKDCPDIEQVWCLQQKTPRKMCHCMLQGLSWQSYHAWFTHMTIHTTIYHITRGDVQYERPSRT